MNYSKYSEYKKTGIEWLGEIPKHWNNWRLSKIANFRRGSFPQPYGLDKWYDDKNGMPFIQVFDVDSNMRLKPETKRRISKEGAEKSVFIEKGTLILTIQGSIGRIAITQYDAYVDRTLLIFQSYNVDIDVNFFKHIITVLFEFEEKKAIGSTIKTINKEKLSRFVIPVPTKQEQTIIANFLDYKIEKISRFIKNKKELIKLLNEQKEAIINKVVTKGLNPNAPTKDSRIEWLGAIPANWEVSKLKYLTYKIVDGAHFTPTYVDEGVPFLRITDLKNQSIDLNDVRYIPIEEHLELIKRCNPEKGDVLLSKNGTIGITKTVDWDWEFSIFVSICLIKLKPILNADFFSVLFGSKAVEVQITESGQTTSVTNLHLEKIRELICVLPPINEQKELVAFIKSETLTLNKTIKTIEKEITLVEEYKTALIAEAVTGKIDVRDFTIPKEETPLAMVAEEAVIYNNR